MHGDSHRPFEARQLREQPKVSIAATKLLVAMWGLEAPSSRASLWCALDSRGQGHDARVGRDGTDRTADADVRVRELRRPSRRAVGERPCFEKPCFGTTPRFEK